MRERGQAIMQSAPVLLPNEASPVDVSGLTVSLLNASGLGQIVQGASFRVGLGEVLGIVGESGCGKTTTALSLLGYWPSSLQASGSVLVAGRQVVGATPRFLRSLRGRIVSYVPQNPTSALNPARRIGSLFAELLVEHGVVSGLVAARPKVLAALQDVALSEPDLIVQRYPHQLSGGQQQRVAIAMALACKPAVIVLDEPTTGLDVSTQKSLLQLLGAIRDNGSAAMVYVTHDLNVLREIASHVAVMYAGTICEIGPLPVVFSQARHPYTRALLAAAPDINAPLRRITALEGGLQRSVLSSGCRFLDRCAYALEGCGQNSQHLETVEGGHRVACQRWTALPQEAKVVSDLRSSSGVVEGSPILSVHKLGVTYQDNGVLTLRTRLQAKVVEGVSFSLSPGEVVALVGESGSGKTTIAKVISGSMAPSEGQIEFDSCPLAGTVRDRMIEQRRRIQLIFQNPDSSLNPRRRVGNILAGAVQSFYRATRAERRRRAEQALIEVRLPPSYMDRFPPQLSGGERQRVAIARALIVNPDVLLCDEILSALDVSVQAGILALLHQLVRSRGLAILFISHDLSVVRSVADRVLVLYRGRVVESGPAPLVFEPPFHPYLCSLLEALPGQAFVESRLPPGTKSVAQKEYPDSLCGYLNRCKFALEQVCTSAPPPLQRVGAKELLCHISPPELAAKARVVDRQELSTLKSKKWTSAKCTTGLPPASSRA